MINKEGNLQDLINTVKDGFTLENSNDQELDIAFNSLKLALKAYFSTYQCFKNNLNIFTGKSVDSEVIDFHHQSEYSELCTETLIHFQHFFELACKKILKEEHPLLSDLALSKAPVLHKLLNGKKLSDEESIGLRSIEFSEAISRLCELIKSEQIKDYDKLLFIRDNKDVLNQVNVLRNRIWHRGVFVLRYAALDKFICKYVLPLVQNFMHLDCFTGNDKAWKYRSLSCGVDPISELISEYRTDPINVKKVAFIKELGRAAYNNPLYEGVMSNKKPFMNFAELYNREHIRRAVRISEAEAKHELASIEMCPVCSVESLVIFSESECDYDESGYIVNGYTYTDRVKCECCDLSLSSGIDNASLYGYTNIKDFWVMSES
jgi:hypothetical protein